MIPKKDRTKGSKLGFAGPEAFSNNRPRSSALLGTDGWSDALKSRIANQLAGDAAGIRDAEMRAAMGSTRALQVSHVASKLRKASLLELDDHERIATTADVREVLAKAANTARRDAGVCHVAQIADRLWRRNPEGWVTAGQLRDWRAAGMTLSPRSAAQLDTILSDGIADVARFDIHGTVLAKVAHDIQSQDDFDAACHKMGLVSDRVDHRLARAYLAKLVNGKTAQNSDTGWNGNSSAGDAHLFRIYEGGYFKGVVEAVEAWGNERGRIWWAVYNILEHSAVARGESDSIEQAKADCDAAAGDWSKKSAQSSPDDAIKAILANDEASTDEELVEHLIKELGLERGDAEDWVDDRDMYLTGHSASVRVAKSPEKIKEKLQKISNNWQEHIADKGLEGAREKFVKHVEKLKKKVDKGEAEAGEVPTHYPDGDPIEAALEPSTDMVGVAQVEPPTGLDMAAAQPNELSDHAEPSGTNDSVEPVDHQGQTMDATAAAEPPKGEDEGKKARLALRRAWSEVSPGVSFLERGKFASTAIRSIGGVDWEVSGGATVQSGRCASMDEAKEAAEDVMLESEGEKK